MACQPVPPSSPPETKSLLRAYYHPPGLNIAPENRPYQKIFQLHLHLPPFFRG